KEKFSFVIEQLLFFILEIAHGAHRSGRSPPKAARPASSRYRRATEEHGQGGAAVEYLAARGLEGDRRAGVRFWRSTCRSQPPRDRADRVWSRIARLRPSPI